MQPFSKKRTPAIALNRKSQRKRNSLTFFILRVKQIVLWKVIKQINIKLIKTLPHTRVQKKTCTRKAMRSELPNTLLQLSLTTLSTRIANPSVKEFHGSHAFLNKQFKNFSRTFKDTFPIFQGLHSVQKRALSLCLFCSSAIWEILWRRSFCVYSFFFGVLLINY